MSPHLRIVSSAAFALALAIGPVGATLASAKADNSAPRVPVLLELFTSEGCSSCPPADALLEKLDHTQPFHNVDLIVLSEHVDYWDALGWKDRFSSSQFTARQYDYAQKIDPTSGSYTPELVVDGRAGMVGSDWDAVSAAIEHARAVRKHPMSITRVSRLGHSVKLHVDAAAPGMNGVVLYVAVADDHVSTHVARGENAGRTLSHVAVVRTLMLAGAVSSQRAIDQDVTVPLPDGANTNGMRIVAFTQDQRTGTVLSLASGSL